MSKTVFPVKVPPPIMFLIPLIAGISMHFFWRPLEFFSDGFTNQLIGWSLIVLGFFLGFWAKKTFAAHGVETKFMPVKTIVSIGPYAHTRNPLYLTLILMYVGIALVANTLWPLILIPVPIAYLFFRVILLEEAYLEKEFGEEYKKYKGKVRRWI